MKIQKIVFTPTGKMRTPKAGDYFMRNGSMIKSEGVHADEYPIYKIEVIEEDWKPKEWEKYYHVTLSAEVDRTAYSPSCYGDIDRLNVGNCFPYTPEGKAKAERVAKKFKEILNNKN